MSSYGPYGSYPPPPPSSPPTLPGSGAPLPPPPPPRPVRKPLALFDRIKFIVALVVLFWFFVWSAMSDNPILPFSDAVNDTIEHKWPLFLLLAIAGLRRGEVIALRRSDLDLNAGALRVRQSAVLVGNRVVVGEPKSRAGHRTVALDDETTRRLAWHHSRQQLQAHKAGRTDPKLVFTTASGERLDPAYVSRHFARLIRLHGLPSIRLHDLRHFMATQMLAHGVAVVTVSQRLGHARASTTLNVYGHCIPGADRDAAHFISDLISIP